jgi:hypothetical protein
MTICKRHGRVFLSALLTKNARKLMCWPENILIHCSCMHSRFQFEYFKDDAWVLPSKNDKTILEYSILGPTCWEKIAIYIWFWKFSMTIIYNVCRVWSRTLIIYTTENTCVYIHAVVVFASIIIALLAYEFSL